MIERNPNYTDKEIGIIFPCYINSTPTIVVEFLQKVKLQADYFFAITTYGNFDGGTVPYFDQMVNSAGFKFDYINGIKMVDNSLKFYDMEKQISMIPSKHIDENLEIIVSDIKAKRKYIKKVNFLKKGFSKIGFKLYNKEVGDYDKKFSIEAHCNGCGVCAKVCPVNNIVMKSAPTFTGNCIRCYACTQNCPQNAIRFKGEKSKVRFRNENVSLKELIEANDY